MSQATHFDVIIIGTGAGGGTLAHQLAPSGKRILLLERGDYLPRERDNWDSSAVFIEQKYQAKETWSDDHSNTFSPGTHYCVGGNTKVYGAALLRLRGGLQWRHASRRRYAAWPLRYEEGRASDHQVFLNRCGRPITRYGIHTRPHPDLLPSLCAAEDAATMDATFRPGRRSAALAGRNVLPWRRNSSGSEATFIILTRRFQFANSEGTIQQIAAETIIRRRGSIFAHRSSIRKSKIMSRKAQSTLENLRLAIHGVTAPFSCEGTCVPDKPVTFVFRDKTRFEVIRAKNAFEQKNAVETVA